MVTQVPAVEEIWRWLDAIPDPEIPAISILDLGIVRDVAWSHDGEAAVLHVAITPTYSGCPAVRAIERDIVETLGSHGVERVALEVRLFPAWTTDWIGPDAREKLRRYGISPPRARDVAAPGTVDLVELIARFDERAQCPRCGSTSVEALSRFGSTPCKAHYRCIACREPFDHFKSH